MSGYADYNIDLFTYPSERVPVVVATEQSFAPYGNFVHNFNDEKVMITPWPVSGKRELMKGTGVGGGVIEDKFLFWEEECFMKAHNLAVGCDPYTTAVLTDVKSILTREANYHPDSGQVFYPVDEVPFYLLLAKEGDDIKATDFVAFYFDGTVGCQIKPGIWHQPPYPVRKAEFLNKQGAVHACVGYDSIEEEECWLEIILV